jgi:hypothetical protein
MQGYNRVEDALDDARNARSPADAVAIMFAAIRLQQQQIADLEKAVGLQDLDSSEAIRSRARRLVEERSRLRGV